MEIDVKELTTYDICEDGKSVVLKLADADGNATALTFKIAELGNLVMTLPSLIEAALQRQFLDTSLRFAYPIGSWSVEQASDPASVIVTLRTQDGFGVSFSMAKSKADELGNAMSRGSSLATSPLLAH
jgi:hypothetical protein